MDEFERIVKIYRDVVYIGEGENPKDNIGYILWEKAFKEVYGQPERSKREDSCFAEFGCSVPISFITSDGIKTMHPGKRYDDNLNEIGDAVL